MFTVVRGEDDHGVVPLARFFEGFKNATELVVDVRYAAVVVGFDESDEVLVDAVISPFVSVLNAIDEGPQ